MDEQRPDFQALIQKYLSQSLHKEEKLASLAQERFGSIPGFKEEAKASTIRNWRYAFVNKVEKWRLLVALASLLRLSRAEADELCLAAGLDNLTLLQDQRAKPEEQALFDLWMKPVFAKQVEISLSDIQESQLKIGRAHV